MITYNLYTLTSWGEPDRLIDRFDNYQDAHDAAVEAADDREEVVLIAFSNGDFALIGPGAGEED